MKKKVIVIVLGIAFVATGVFWLYNLSVSNGNYMKDIASFKSGITGLATNIQGIYSSDSQSDETYAAMIAEFRKESRADIVNLTLASEQYKSEYPAAVIFTDIIEYMAQDNFFPDSYSEFTGDEVKYSIFTDVHNLITDSPYRNEWADVHMLQYMQENADTINDIYNNIDR